MLSQSHKRALTASVLPFPMSEMQRLRDVEILARIAARLAGRDPDEHVSIELGGVTVFQDVMWQYPDFLGRAKEAYSVLARSTGPMTL